MSACDFDIGLKNDAAAASRGLAVDQEGGREFVALVVRSCADLAASHMSLVMY